MNMKGKRKIGRKILAFVLSVCMLFTVQPNLWDGVMAQAAEKVENDTDVIIQTLRDRIVALPDVEEYLALEPDMEEDEDAYVEWEEKLYEYAEEALVIWEEYETLTEEQQAQMPEKELAKLMAWVELAETLAESSQVMTADDASHTHCICGRNMDIGDHTAHNTGIEYKLLTINDSGQLLINGEVKEDAEKGYTLTSGYYYLQESQVTEIGTITIDGNVTLCLNGGTLKHMGETGSVIVVSANSTFTLCDCKNDSGCIMGGKGESVGGGGIFMYAGNDSETTFNMFGGVIKENQCAVGGGGGIYCDGTKEAINPKVNIYGGKIIDNSCGGTGGGINAAYAQVNIFGGSIEGNKASRGGGINLNNSNIEISNASIINNTITDANYGGGVFSTQCKVFSISGTVNISGNTDGDEKTSNVFFRTGLFFDVTDSLEGSCIGVTVQKPPTQAKPTPVKVAGGKEYGISTADWSCFFSDKDGYEILRKETTDGSEEKNPLNELYLALPGSWDLSGLTISTEGVKLEPDFQENKTTYTATVGNDVKSIDITATLKNTPAEGEEKPLTMKIDAESAKKINSGEKQTVKLNEGKNTIAITVTSGGISKTYTIEIERKAPEVPAEYKVTLNGKGETGTDLKSYTYGTGAKLPTDWTKTGYDFAGWYEDESCEGTAVTEISATTTGDKEYWAKWTAKTYTVAYSSDGGTIANENNFKEYTYGTGMTLPTPAKTGYTFDGWYEQSDFSGSKVTGISATDTGAKTYYAKWTLSSYTISYNLDGGTAAGNPTTYTVESSTITLKNPTKEGYTFTGWSGTGLTGEQNTAVTIPKGSTENREYTAHWAAAGYKVTLEGKGGTGGTSLSTYTHGTKVELPTDWMKNGYTFAGWYEDESCEGTAVTEIPANATGDKKYWAGWTANSYTISYNLDGGTAAGNPASYTVESDAITLTNPTKEGYTFTGWSGTGLTGEQNTTVTIPKGSTGNRTYTAHWKLADYTVALHPNGGTGGTNLTSYTYGTVTTLPTNWTKKGYVFGGWYDNENLTGTAVTNISGTATGNKEYWAKWTDNIAPVIGTLTYNYQPKNLWQWLIGKDSLVITVPVTEEGSGADKITYTETPDGGTASTKTAAIQNGKAEITVSADFKGTISIACTDKANNTSASVTVGAGVAPNGIIIEDNAPQIAFQVENAELLPSGEYKTVPDIAVTVVDNKNNSISGGIASVNYKIGNGSEKTVAHDYTTSMIVNDNFTIPASEISAGETKITVTATDNAGNSVTQNYTVKVHTHSGTLVPAVEPTCTTAGNKEYYTCTCGKWFSDSGCTDEITDHTEVVKKALGHDFAGKYQFDTEEHWMKCSRCAATDSREAHSFVEGSNHCTKCEFEKAGEGHTHTGELHEKVEPTCTTKGNTAYYTCNCGKWFSDSSCTEEITDKSEIEIAALEHDFVMKHDQNEHWQQCSRCSLEQSRGLHEYDDDSDTDCNVCGYVRTIQHTHSGTLVPAVEPTCTEDGHEAYYTCSCGKWFSDSGCMNEITDHASVTVEKRGHDFSGGYQSDENGHWKVCARCNVAQAAESHVFDDDNDTDCNQCGYRRNIENQGNVSKDVEKDEKAPDTVLSDSAEELADTILTEEEKGQIGNGIDIKFILNVKDAGDTVSGGDKTAVQQTLDENTAVKGFSVGQYLDISLFKVIGDTRSAISQTARKLTIVINVPDSLKSKDSAKPRTYAIIRVHDGAAEVLEDLDSDADTVTIATDRFSAYALVYKEAGSGADVTPSPTPGGGDKPTPTPGGDKPSPTPGGSDEPTPTPGGSDKPSPTPGGKDNVTPAPSPSEKPEKVSGKEKRKIEIHSGLKAIQKGKKLQISWGRVTGADGYSVYVQYCGKDFSAKSLNQVKSGKKTKITVKKVNGKKLDTTKNFKLYVVAWKWKNGKKSTLTKTLTIHVAGKDSVKYTNVKSIQLKKTSYTLKKGGTVTLRPKAVLYDKHKKQLSAAHCKEFRYLSSNKKVATVTAGGKVKAKGTGECTIYVFAKNGCRRKIKIKVKK